MIADRKHIENPRAIVWFRKDLRLKDNPSLDAARKAGQDIVPVFIWDEEEGGQWSPGAASRWWLHQSLKNLEQSIETEGGKLILRKGKALEVLPQLAKSIGADTVYYNRVYDPSGRDVQTAIETNLLEIGVSSHSFKGSLLNDPWDIKNGSGNPYQVFTPYWRAARSGIYNKPLSYEPRELSFVQTGSKTETLESLGLLPDHPWHQKLHLHWTVSEDEGHKMIKRTTDEVTQFYSNRRNIPAVDGTSKLSPYLAWGNISPRQVCHAVLNKDAQSGSRGENKFLTEIGWREFSYHLLHHFPRSTDNPLRPKYAAFPWREDAEALSKWQFGNTGYALVDAGMKQLYETGWMHNRVRMVVASFLVKHLLLSWKEGASWFWDTLVDADLASNTQGWQWAAGCGADAAPYFRIFNPILQGEKFDRSGRYVRKWVKPLKDFPTKWLFKPWETPSDILSEQNITLGQNYPNPCVNHAEARTRALEALATLPKN